MIRQQPLDLPAPTQGSPLPDGLAEQWRDGYHAGRVRALDGYVQFREGPGDAWRFAVSGFDHTHHGRHGFCSVIRANGTTDHDVRIDARSRIQIAGKLYGPARWDH